MTRPSLTVSKIKSLRKPGIYGDATMPTLYLRVKESGAKSFVQRLVIDGKRHDIGLGGFPLTTLAEARDAAYQNRRLARSGGNPIAERHKSKIPTFAEATLATFEAHRSKWSNDKTASNFIQRLQKHAFPIHGDMRVSNIGREDVLRVLTPIWQEKSETARQVRQRVRTVFAWCVSHGYAQANMAGEVLDGALPTQQRVKAHLRSLPHSETSDALRVICESNASIAAKSCLRFLVLTAARSGEARGARWSEIDFDKRLWTIPAERMKTRKGHRVPLANEALKILEEVKMLNDGSDLIFPTPRKVGGELSDMTLTKILRTLGLADKATVHGFRATFRSWAADEGAPREVAEQALAHVVQGVEGAYQRSDLLDKRNVLMRRWAAYVTGAPEEKIIQLRA